MIRKLTLYVAFSILFFALSNAQDNMPSALDQLAKQCQQVIALNDTIKVRQARLDKLKELLSTIRQDWWQTCNDALSSPDCDDKEIRLSTIDRLIRLTDQKFEADIFSQLLDAKNNAAIRSLKPIGQFTNANGRDNSASQRKTSKKAETKPKSTKPAQTPMEESNVGGKDEAKEKAETPVVEEQPKEEQDVESDDSSTSPDSKDSKANPDKPVAPDKQNNKGQNDKTKIEQKKETNRKKTYDAVKDRINKTNKSPNSK